MTSRPAPDPELPGPGLSGLEASCWACGAGAGLDAAPFAGFALMAALAPLAESALGTFTNFLQCGQRMSTPAGSAFFGFSTLWQCVQAKLAVAIGITSRRSGLERSNKTL